MNSIDLIPESKMFLSQTTCKRILFTPSLNQRLGTRNQVQPIPPWFDS